MRRVGSWFGVSPRATRLLALIAGADPRVRTAFRAALRRQPYFGAPPSRPEVICVEDIAPAIARAEAAIRRAQATPSVVVFDGTGSEAVTGSQRVAALTAADAERVLRTDSILVLDEYAFNHPAGRLDHFLGLLEGQAFTRPTLTKRGIVGRLAVALFAPVILVGVFAAGMGVGRAEARPTADPARSEPVPTVERPARLHTPRTRR